MSKKQMCRLLTIAMVNPKRITLVFNPNAFTTERKHMIGVVYLQTSQIGPLMQRNVIL